MLEFLLSGPEVQDGLRLQARARRVALGLTQTALAARSGVPLGSLKRFEQNGEISLTALLALAAALDCLGEFRALFPLPPAESLSEIEAQNAAASAPLRRVRTPKCG